MDHHCGGHAANWRWWHQRPIENIHNQGALVYNRSGSLVQSSGIYGNGSIDHIGAGRVVLQSINVSSGNIFNSGVGELCLESEIAGSRALVNRGAGKLILDRAATHTGGTTISAGSLWVGGDTGSGSIAGDILNDAELYFNTTGPLTYGDVISGSGAVIQSGAGTTTFTQNQNYTGATVISDGTLELGDTGGFPVSPAVA